MSKGEKKNNIKPATAGGFGLNFSNAPVSASAIEDALKEQREKQEKERALAYAKDVSTCQDTLPAV